MMKKVCVLIEKDAVGLKESEPLFEFDYHIEKDTCMFFYNGNCTDNYFVGSIPFSMPFIIKEVE